MSGNTNFPTALDDDTSLYDVTDGSSSIQAAHHNNLKEGLKAVQAKVGIRDTSAPTALDYRLGHPTGGHDHSGATGQGQPISPSGVLGAPSSIGSPSTVAAHMADATTHGMRYTLNTGIVGSAVATTNFGRPISFGRTAIIESVRANLRRGPSGATAAFTVRVGGTAIFGASVGFGVRFAPGATDFGNASPNLVTYPSGAIITIDVNNVGSNSPGIDLSVVFVFRELA